MDQTSDPALGRISSPPSDSLARLPNEVRNRIYDFLLNFDTDEGYPYIDVRGGRKPPNSLAIFRVNRMYHAKTSSYFYSENFFELGPPIFGYTLHDRAELRLRAPLLPPISDIYVRFLRNIEIVIPAEKSNIFNLAEHVGLISVLTRTGGQFLTVIINFSASPYPGRQFLHANHTIIQSLHALIKSCVVKVLFIDLNKRLWFTKGVGAAL
ncbi:hypothetical protein BCR34DRAFT_604676 [Clohesyomyces aquaticus]|uniref:F-box domain-containing protein n=1 Tax=Clohesyomyces aquaticus TaxID=1231657 RepID=A0A1Y1Z3V7_9PLEO|nr:hypothetical protein BCR34DRAFT_604676 [Clohesyomyces aquaticus]